MRLIDADALMQTYAKFVAPSNNSDFENEPTWNDAVSLLESAPTVDAEPVIRCKDCYYCATEKSFGKEYLYCDAFYEHAEGDLIGASLMVEPNHFCSWGERREDETN